MPRSAANSNAPETSPACVLDGGASSDPVSAVRAVLSLPDEQLDYAEAKLAIDQAIDPSLEIGAHMATLDRMSDKVLDMASI